MVKRDGRRVGSVEAMATGASVPVREGVAAASAVVVKSVAAALAAEDYLADIFRLTSRGEPATTGNVAEVRGVAPATATSMFKRLAKDGLVNYREYEGVVLTPAGQLAALQVVRRHRLVERFLTDVLNIGWDRVDELADRMEHNLPDEVVDGIEALLGHPYTCPHGYVIPDRHGQLEARSLQALAGLEVGREAIVRQVDEHVPGLLTYLNSVGIVPGVRVRVAQLNPLDETLSLEVEGRTAVVGPRIAQAIQVELAEA